MHTETVSLEKKGPVVNVRGRHLQLRSSFLYVSLFTGDYLHLKTSSSSFTSSSKLKDSHFNQTSTLVEKTENNGASSTYITMDPPLPGPYLVQAITCHRAQMSTHTHKHTVFNMFTVMYCPIQTLKEISCQQSNSWTTSIRQDIIVFVP